MTDLTTGQPARRSKDERIAAIIASALLALVAIGFIGAGGAALWADSKKDEQGYIATGSDRFSTDTAAMATESLDVDLDGADALLDDGVFGKVRINAESKDGKPLFVGIARSSDVSDYLRGSAHDIIDDVDYSPLPGRLPHQGRRRGHWARPATSASGTRACRAPASSRSSGTSRRATGPSS